MELRYYDYSLALFDITVKTADKTYADDYCRLTGQYYGTLQAINHSGTTDAEYYENGGSSLNVQVCFPAGTPIILADETTKNIEDIRFQHLKFDIFIIAELCSYQLLRFSMQGGGDMLKVNYAEETKEKINQFRYHYPDHASKNIRLLTL